MPLEPKSDWKELITKKDEFLHILRILNHYYESQSRTQTKLYRFRRSLVATSPEVIRIFFSKIGVYEYFVSASLDQSAELTESWVHIDGIAEERAKLTEIGNLEHPVFSITCLGDLYLNHTVPYAKKSKIKKNSQRERSL